MLIFAIFTPESSMSVENKPKYLFLLAYAVSVYEVWNEVCMSMDVWTHF